MTTEPDDESELELGLDHEPAPLRLLAQDDVDLHILSAALQDARLSPADIVWERAARRLTLSMDRYCWECGGTRVRAALQFGDVQAVQSRDLAREPDATLELLALDFAPLEAPGGRILLMFSGGGDLKVDVECLDAVLADLEDRHTTPTAPSHDLGEDQD